MSRRVLPVAYVGFLWFLQLALLFSLAGVTNFMHLNINCVIPKVSIESIPLSRALGPEQDVGFCDAALTAQ